MKKLTLGILAPVDAGKTTLSEALLFRAGEIRKLGRVDHGDSFLDGNPIERNRGITVFSKQAMLTCGNTEITLLDTPGHVDFSSEMERVLSVIDAALLIISAPDGVRAHTETLWKLLWKRNIPVFVFINKMDLAVRDRETIIRELTDSFGDGFVNFGRNRNSEEFLDDLTMYAAELTEPVLEGRPLKDEEIARPIRERRIYPCIFGSALKLEGIEYIMDCLDRYTLEPEYGESFGARVFQIRRDSRGERLVFMKLTGGSLQVKETIHGTDENDESWEEKVNQIRIYSGMKFRTVDRVTAGEVCAVTGLTRLLPGDVVGDEKPGQEELLEPFLTYTVELPDGVDMNTALRNIRELAEEDPKLHVAFVPETSEIRIRLMGQVQLEVLQTMIEERYGYRVEFGAGHLIYMETIENTVEGVGHFEPLRHYAEVHLLLEPGERGSGIIYDSTISEDLLPRNWQRLILSGLEQKEHIGVLIGAPVTDIKITLAAGKAHEKHTSGGDFREASNRAVRNGLMKAKSVLLEPWFRYRIELPTEQVGRAMTDIRQMGGQVGDLTHDENHSVLTGEAPAAGLIDYPLTLASYTAGQGRLVCRLKGYDICHNPEEVMAEYPYDPERDPENPADSVFVSHGSSNIVHWDEVEQYMHLPSVIRKAPDAEPERVARAAAFRESLASDEELMAIFERTYGNSKKTVHRGPVERATRAKERAREYRRPRPKAESGPLLLIIDGYNLINYWEPMRTLANSDLGAAREQLVDRLINYQGYMQCELIVVFDAYKVPFGTGSEEKHFGVTVIYTKADEPADIRIGVMVDTYGRGRRVRVVSSDNLVQQNALGHNAERTSSREFVEEVTETEAEIREVLQDL